MAIRVLNSEKGYIFMDIEVHGEVFSLSPEEIQELHILLGQDCKDVNCPCRIAGREDGQIAGYDAGYGEGQIAGYEEGQEAPKGKDHR